MSILNIQESSAQLNKPQPDTKNKTPDLTKNDKISKISEGEDINRINSQSLLQENFQLESEKKLLQELRKRRKEIEGYREELLTDKGALDSVKQYIDNRLKLLENVQYKLKPYLHDYNQQDKQEIKRLVKVYESMQPKDAAKIFDDLQLGILMEVAVNMKKSSLASVLAKMKPEKARELTIRLATKRNAHIFDNQYEMRKRGNLILFFSMIMYIMENHCTKNIIFTESKVLLYFLKALAFP